MTSPNKTTGLTTEQKLAAVIAAQIKGGLEYNVGPFWKLDNQFAHFHAMFKEIYGHEIPYIIHVLAVLLDPEGLKAAYGDEVHYCSECHQPIVFEKSSMGYQGVARAILDSWLSGGSGAAITTAFNLLPQKS